MKKAIRVFISIIVLLLGVVGADCLYGLTIGGNYGWIALLICLGVGLILTTMATFFIFNKDERNQAKVRDCFAIILIGFMFVCVFMYSPLNKLTGSTDYTEKQVQVVKLEGLRTVFPVVDPEWEVTVEEQNGESYVVYDYSPFINYDEGDAVSIKEFNGGFGMKYSTINYAD